MASDERRKDERPDAVAVVDADADAECDAAPAMADVAAMFAALLKEETTRSLWLGCGLSFCARSCFVGPPPAVNWTDCCA